MNIFKNMFGNSISKDEIQKKGMEGIINYKNKNYKAAVSAFEEYFTLKGIGKYPDLDNDDNIMLINLGNAKQYSKDFNGAIIIYDKIITSNPSWGAPYLMKSVCFYKLGNIEKSKYQWELAKKFGEKFAQNSFETTIIKFN